MAVVASTAPQISAAAATATRSPAASALFRFVDPRLSESSGLAASSFDDTIYTHNDSGDAARFYRVNQQGQTVAVYTLRGARAIDWEDMAVGTDALGNHVLYLADIGDNAGSRASIDVYRVTEPHGSSGDVGWTRYRFAYPDGSHDAEAFLVDPRSHRMYVATKAWLDSGTMYAAPAVLSTNAVNMLTPVAPVPALVTSAAFAADGEHVVLLTYLGAYWASSVAGPWHRFDVPQQSQNEAIAFARGGEALLVGSEGVHSTVYRVALPWADQPPGASSPASSAAAPVVTSDERGSPWPPAAVVALAALALVLLAGLAAAVRIRHRRG